ncbi:MAG: hypothetical protein U1E76_21710 [Planctomycetota bacterium]
MGRFRTRSLQLLSLAGVLIVMAFLVGSGNRRLKAAVRVVPDETLVTALVRVGLSPANLAASGYPRRAEQRRRSHEGLPCVERIAIDVADTAYASAKTSIAWSG